MNSDLTREEIAAIARRGYENPVFFVMTFLPHWFPVDGDPSKIPWFHKGLLAILTRKVNFLREYPEDLAKIITNFTYTDGEGQEHSMFRLSAEGQLELVLNQFTMLMVPRGYAKTTCMNAATVYNTVYVERKFTVYLSESSTHATTQLNAVKAELSSNARLHSIFGEFKPAKDSGLKWTDDFAQCTNGVTLAARGRGSQVRGLNVNAQRPDNILLDDVEDTESVKTAEQRQKAQDWLYRDVMPALPRNDPTAAITAVGTLLHLDALLMVLARDPRFHSIIFGALDKQGDALWPEFMPKEKIERERQAALKVGQLNGFMMEYFSTTHDETSAKFRESYIVREAPESEIVGVAIACDPAISDRAGADNFGLALVGMTAGGIICIFKVFLKKGVLPREQVDKFFEFYAEAKKLHPSPHAGIESIAYQKALVHLVREEMFRRHTYFEIEELSHGRTGKVERVEGVLQPRYAAKYIRHVGHFPEYESQLLDWPNGKKDGPDVVAMAITLLDPYAAAAIDPNVDLAADEYPELSAMGHTSGWAP